MKKKYRNKLPKGSEVKGYNVYVENGEIIVAVEFKERFEPKDGDFLADRDGDVFIYSDKDTRLKGYVCAYCGEYCKDRGSICLEFSNSWTIKEGCRFATSEEKAAFIKRLKDEKHLCWNEETKRLEPIRWRACDGEPYYYIDPSGNVRVDTDYYTFADNERYEAGNYCRFKEELVPYARQVKEIYKKLK